MNNDVDAKIVIGRALRILEVFRAIDPDMPMGEAVSFLLIANGESREGGGLSVTKLGTQGGFVLSSASRYVQALGKADRHKRPGHELVSDLRDRADDRRKILRLTPKGNRIITQIRSAIGA